MAEEEPVMSEITLEYLGEKERIGEFRVEGPVKLKKAGEVKETGKFRYALCVFVDAEGNSLDVKWAFPPKNLEDMVGDKGSLFVTGKVWGNKNTHEYQGSGDSAFPAGEAAKKAGGGAWKGNGGGSGGRQGWEPLRNITGLNLKQYQQIIVSSYKQFTTAGMGDDAAQRAAVSVGMAVAQGQVYPDTIEFAGTSVPEPGDDDIPF
jgi:hypothetical protein